MECAHWKKDESGQFAYILKQTQLDLASSAPAMQKKEMEELIAVETK